MAVVVVVGTQWGDEGKGKVVDVLARSADVIARFGGGANAGHTIVSEGRSVVLNLVPCGVRHAGRTYVLGAGMVIDPRWLVREIRELKRIGLLANDADLHISELAHVTLPYHRELERLREETGAKVGSTRNGIGPTYETKVGRRGVRMRDLVTPSRLREKVAANLACFAPILRERGGDPPDLEAVLSEYGRYGEALARYVGDVSLLVDTAVRAGRNVLLEGSQGTLLDVDYGSYPFVTSSSVLAGGACAGVGIGPTAITDVVGIVKAYTSRASQHGPFPTRLDPATETVLREAGHEFIPNFMRNPHRCGWLDAAALRVAARLNGLSGIAVTKLDVLGCLPVVKMCVGYDVDGTRRAEMPLDFDETPGTPVYEEFEGWGDLAQSQSLDDLPASARAYLRRIEELMGVPIWMVSVGADRARTFVLHDPFTAARA